MNARDAAKARLADAREATTETDDDDDDVGIPAAFTPNATAPTEWDVDRVHVFDIEASNWTEPVAVGHLEPNGTDYAAYTVENGDPISAFVDDVMHYSNRNHRFVAHNGGSYDFGFIIEELIDRDLEFSMLKNGQDKPIVIEVWDENGKPRFFQDSVVLLPRSLNTLAESFVPEMDNIEGVDYDRIQSDWDAMSSAFRDDMMEYLENDCRVLRAVLGEFTDIITDLSDGRVGPQLTIGSTTLSVYQTSFFDTDAVTKIRPSFEGSDDDVEGYVREAYTGGRTEVFGQYADPANGPFMHYDVSSLFPYCYTEFDLPVGNPSYQDEPNPDIVLTDEWDHMGGAVYVEGHVPDDVDIPVLPVRITPENANAAKTIFPTGDVSGWWMLREVRYAVRNGYLELDADGVGAAVLARNEPQFEAYGNHLYGLKSSIDSDENPGKYNVVKFLLNSFYGKFALDRNQSNIHRKDPEELAADPTGMRKVGNTRETQDRLFDKGVVSEDDTAMSPYILPRISAAITAQARIVMHQYFRMVQAEGGNVYYCDTDSIVTDVELPTTNPDPETFDAIPEAMLDDELGCMDLETVAAEGYFLRPKTYGELHDGDLCPCPDCDGDDTGVELKGKGMKDLDDFVTFDSYRQAYHQKEPERIGVEWSDPKGLMASLKDSNGETALEVGDYSRALGGFDDKRVHDSDGQASRPIDVDALEARREQEKEAKRRALDRRDRRKAAKARGIERRKYHRMARWDTTAGDEPLESDDKLDSALSAAENKENLRDRRLEEARDRVR